MAFGITGVGVNSKGSGKATSAFLGCATGENPFGSTNFSSKPIVACAPVAVAPSGCGGKLDTGATGCLNTCNAQAV